MSRRIHWRHIAYVAGLMTLIALGNRTQPDQLDLHRVEHRLVAQPAIEPQTVESKVPETATPERAAPPVAAREAVQAPARFVSVTPTVDSISALIEETPLRASQIRALRALAEEKEQDIRQLQEAVYAAAPPTEEVRTRVDEIQEAFESEVAAVVTANQMRRFHTLKLQRKIGTPVIVIPRSTHPR